MSPEFQSQQRTVFSELLVGKIVRVVAFISYISYAERIERGLFFKFYGEDPKTVAQWNNYWVLANKFATSINATLNDILSSNSELIVKHVIPLLEAEIRSRTSVENG